MDRERTPKGERTEEMDILRDHWLCVCIQRILLKKACERNACRGFVKLQTKCASLSLHCVECW